MKLCVLVLVPLRNGEVVQVGTRMMYQRCYVEPYPVASILAVFGKDIAHQYRQTDSRPGYLRSL